MPVTVAELYWLFYKGHVKRLPDVEGKRRYQCQFCDEVRGKLGEFMDHFNMKGESLGNIYCTKSRGR